MTIITIRDLLKLDKRLVLVIGQDEDLKKKIARSVARSRRDWVLLVNPENSMHPYRQCETIEKITICVNVDRYFVITNSSYFVDHLVNLMKAAKSKDKDKVKEMFLMKAKAAFIKVNDVAVFDCENGKIKNILNKRTGMINWDTFSKVAEWACDLYFDMED